MNLQLPNDVSVKELYLDADPKIWVLIWVLKRFGCDQYLCEMILKIPFKTQREKNHFNGLTEWIEKNGVKHGPIRGWHENGQLGYEWFWKIGQRDGLERGWYRTGQLQYECSWKNGKQDGLQHMWYQDGQLMYENFWKNGLIISKKKFW
jgi:antitoxin component YwqK of YwqJK toxin-antitoxin module